MALQQYYSTQQIADMFSMDDETVRRRIRKGRFGSHVIKDGRDWRISEKGVQYYIDNATYVPPQPFRMPANRKTKPSTGAPTGKLRMEDIWPKKEAV